jgi:hypothetical protein
MSSTELLKKNTILLKLFQKLERKEILLNLLYDLASRKQKIEKYRPAECK